MLSFTCCSFQYQIEVKNKTAVRIKANDTGHH